jgi:hypothetical protein
MQLRGTDIVVDKIRARKNIISGSGATASLSEADSGSLVLMDRAAGIVFTLPAACKIGTKYEFIASASVTSNAYKVITGAGTELLIGTLASVDTDTSDAMAGFSGNGSTHIAVSANGTTTGGLIGSKWIFEKVSTTQWEVSGTNRGSGTVATPFATS